MNRIADIALITTGIAGLVLLALVFLHPPASRTGALAPVQITAHDSGGTGQVEESDAGAASGTAADAGTWPPVDREPADTKGMISLPCIQYLDSPEARPLKATYPAQKRTLAKYGLVVTHDPAFIPPLEHYGNFYRPMDERAFAHQASLLEPEISRYTPRFFEAINLRYIFFADGYFDKQTNTPCGGFPYRSILFIGQVASFHHELNHAARNYRPAGHQAYLAAVEQMGNDIWAWDRLTERKPSYLNGSRAVRTGNADSTPLLHWLKQGYTDEYGACGGTAEDMAEYGELVMGDSFAAEWLAITGLAPSGDKTADHRKILARLEEMSRRGEIHKAVGEKIRLTREFYQRLM